MKKFGVIFQYELMNYIKNKSYVITTVIIALVAGIIMFVPNFIDIGSVTGRGGAEIMYPMKIQVQILTAQYLYMIRVVWLLI